MSPTSDEELLARQSALQAEAREVLAGLNLAVLVADIDPLVVTGSPRETSHPIRHARSLVQGNLQHL